MANSLHTIDFRKDIIMKANISEILEGVGLGEVKFGLERENVEQILGKPEEKENYSHSDGDDDLAENWHYDELELSLGFDEEDDWRLVTLAVTSQDYKFRDFTPIGLSKKELIEKLNAHKITDLEAEDWASAESPTHELLSSESLGINFWFDEDKLSEVQWSPLFLDDETVNWPA